MGKDVPVDIRLAALSSLVVLFDDLIDGILRLISVPSSYRLHASAGEQKYLIMRLPYWLFLHAQYGVEELQE